MRLTENQQSSCLVSFRTLTIVVLIVMYVGTTPAQMQELLQQDIEDALKDVAPQRYCSRELVAIMKFVCRYRQYVKHPSKKSCKKHLKYHTSRNYRNFIIFSVNGNNDLLFGTFDVDRIGASSYDDYLADSYSVIERGDRYRRGITDECCSRPCYKYQLIKYCNPVQG
jgi:hypothetical protein